MSDAKKILTNLLKLADIRINGDRDGDITVHNQKLYARALAKGSIGLGEAYMDGWWDCEKLDVFFEKLLTARLDRKVKPVSLIFPVLKSMLLNAQTKKRSKKVAEVHYDLGNDFYKDMLDKRMQYTCAYYKNTDNLEEAQKNKLDLICRKLKLKKGERVLELGGGWGGFAKYASENYGVHVTSYNISAEQVKYAREICKGLPVEIIQSDYRDAKGQYDKIASIGMCEHVGPKNYGKFIELARKCLKKRGLFLLHTIGRDVKFETGGDQWIKKYIFPEGYIPSLKELAPAFNNKLIMEDWHNFGADYSKTTYAWWERFEENWHKHKEEYGERFYRMWRYYLLACAGNFRTRRLELWQIVLSKEGILGGYESER
ncbi:cyclopropane fatty acyl phospholipid synthase [Candidatus Woesearchaeota archaeon]|jgi:cyclopropane-fatty-acyl-phospholipid synthase|nr:cyclopropane fatty acyl phospholipid synthase [Candidatus Woesearchaeota archaeon]MBT4368898.1 cyclopropane fatty acyl phospholipid synthase [Candidatus Woesearchaeota archaeon]MBT4712187.1 cyclopropane fatty acyl phospholipid synthase [Candidatus Woesearchaeota archaeon]MBT6639065.1 cyclopropane fatty acyl phospholipid synthase [Candidatus Woesearchaeota archaeon]MBT7134265.1 cyclopropane fatty acyl phospholipid synthase [Candidatus Woesearchaeota archaeon]